MIKQEELKKAAAYFNSQKGQQYPCSNQIVTCGVITRDRDKALSIMQDKGVTLVKQGKNQLEWKLNNEKWIWRYWGYHIRGYRFYKLIVDKDIEMTKDEFEFSILGACGFYCCSFEIV